MHQYKSVKRSMKIACLLLSLAMLLNSAGFAAMLDCEQACCQKSSPLPSTSHMSCHEDAEMAQMSSDAALQFESWPATPSPQNFIHCGSGVESASLLTVKPNVKPELIALAASEQTYSMQHKNSHRHSELRLPALASSAQLSNPLRS